MENRRKIGTNYERLAGKYLEAHGYQIIEYNFKCNAGEIDIIAKDQEYLVFCEVKYRRTARAGYPMEAVSLAKHEEFQSVHSITFIKISGMRCRAVLMW